jgi:hypothetical protein
VVYRRGASGDRRFGGPEFAESSMSAYPHLSESLPQLATPDEVAPLLSMTPLGVVRQCRAGKIPGVKIAGRWLVHVRKLAEQLDGAPMPDARRATPKIR